MGYSQRGPKRVRYNIVTAAATAKSLQLCPTLCNPWTVACQAPLSVGFPRQEYWSRLPSPSPGDLPDPGIEPGSPALQADSLPSELPGKLSCSKATPVSSMFVLPKGKSRGLTFCNLSQKHLSKKTIQTHQRQRQKTGCIQRLLLFVGLL